VPAREVPLENLVAEAQRVLAICNACRYCEGYCAVFPALEKRRDFTPADVVYLANLCHDCRACYYACMYATGHRVPVPAYDVARYRAWYESLTPPASATAPANMAAPDERAPAPPSSR